MIPMILPKEDYKIAQCVTNIVPQTLRPKCTLHTLQPHHRNGAHYLPQLPVVDAHALCLHLSRAPHISDGTLLGIHVIKEFLMLMSIDVSSYCGRALSSGFRTITRRWIKGSSIVALGGLGQNVSADVAFNTKFMWVRGRTMEQTSGPTMQSL